MLSRTKKEKRIQKINGLSCKILSFNAPNDNIFNITFRPMQCEYICLAVRTVS